MARRPHLSPLPLETRARGGGGGHWSGLVLGDDADPLPDDPSWGGGFFHEGQYSRGDYFRLGHQSRDLAAYPLLAVQTWSGVVG